MLLLLPLLLTTLVTLSVGRVPGSSRTALLAMWGFLGTSEGSYTDYSVGLTWSVVGVDLGAAYVGTTLDEEDVFGTDWGEDTVVFSISKSM